MNIHELKDIIKKSTDLFGKDELAYLSLTSKNESVIRDKIAYRLYLDLDKYEVAREHKRIDLAILEGSKIKDIIELKSMFTFDSISNPKNKILFENKCEEYIADIFRDFEKNNKFLNKETNQYAIIIATHPKQIPNRKYENIIKYYNEISRYSKKVANISILKDNTNDIIHKSFNENDYKIEYSNIESGTVFNTDVEICLWIIQKLK